MPTREEILDFVSRDKSLVISPAGYGKTHFIADCLSVTTGRQLILTHTQAGILSIKNKIQKNPEILKSSYHIETICGFAQKYVKAYYPPTELLDQNARNYFNDIMEKAAILFQKSNMIDILKKTYAGIFVDEYQDCSKSQHALIMIFSEHLPVRVLGDPLQGIFGFNGDLVDFSMDLENFERFNLLPTPWRWKNADKDALGEALSDIRGKLERQETINLLDYSSHIRIVNISNEDLYSTDYSKTIWNILPRREEILFLLDYDLGAQNKAHRLRFAKTYKGSYLLEAMDDSDFYSVAKVCDDAVTGANFKLFYDSVLEKIFSKTELKIWIKDGTSIKQKRGDAAMPSQKLTAIFIEFSQDPSLKTLNKILIFIKELGISIYRHELYYELLTILKMASNKNKGAFESMEDRRNIVRKIGKKFASKCVGTTLLTKGLEFKTVVILNAHKIKDPRNFYVAISRCSHELIIFTKSVTLRPYTN